ncbi:hypothetical protein LMG1861_05093 [Achromobacter piechaudii]|uniref:Uncharacterized protein n=1 Tax=Achromobacter piechaudii TaxID=72556 RepID=A0A6S7EUN9_9BURK|nr:hypothetical protein LMG1861_05093 [Achromobacter piechaudii]
MRSLPGRQATACATAAASCPQGRGRENLTPPLLYLFYIVLPAPVSLPVPWSAFFPRDSRGLSRWTSAAAPWDILFCPRDTNWLSLGTTEGQPYIQLRDGNICLMPLVVFLDPRAFSLPALDHLGAPSFDSLLCHDGVIQATIRTLHPTAQRPVAMAHPLLRHASEASQLRQHVVVIWQACSRHLVPGCAPQQDSTTERLAVRLYGQIAVRQACHVQR